MCCLGRWLLCSLAFVGLTLRPACAAPIDWSEHQDLKAACDLVEFNLQMKSFRGSGRCTMVLPTPLRGAPVPVATDRRLVATFQVASRDALLRLHLQYVEDHNMGIGDDRREILADGKNISVASFSPNRRPKGCELEVFEDSRGNHYKSALVIRDDVRRMVRNPILPKGLDELDFVERTTADGETCWRFSNSATGVDFRLFATTRDFTKLTRFEMYGRDKLEVRVDADWDLVDGRMRLLRRTSTSFHPDGSVIEATEIEFEMLEMNAEIEESEISFTGYADCGSRRVIDRRPDAETHVLYFNQESRENLKNQSSLADVADRLKPLQVPDLARTSPKPTNLWPKLLMLNGTLLLVLSLFLAVRHYRRRGGI